MIILIIGFVVLLLASFTDGALEGYLFESRKSFERKYNVSKKGFFGSLSYERLYTHPNLWNKHLGVFDFYHMADDVRKYFYIIGGMLVGSNYSIRFFTIYLLVIFLFLSATKRLGLYWIRK